jgi:glutathione S-transferase
MITVYAHPFSTCARKVLTTLLENEIPFQFQMVDLMKGEHKQPEHMARQPFGQVPAIDDDGFMLYESRAICKYLDQKVDGKLTPKDAKARAMMEQWLSVETSNFTPHTMPFIMEHFFQRPQEAAKLEAAEAKLKDALGVMDAHLAKNTYFAGDQFSIADISFMPYVGYAIQTKVKDAFAGYPNVMAWWNRVSERPTWAKVAAGAAS